MSTDMDRFKTILIKEDAERIRESADKVSVDLHGQNRREAKRFLSNMINMVRHPFTLEVIHGYNHGTALKEMINSEEINPRIIERTTLTYNLGVTVLSIR